MVSGKASSLRSSLSERASGVAQKASSLRSDLSERARSFSADLSEQARNLQIPNLNAASSVVAAEPMTLFSNLVEYTNDNVLTMCMAATVGLIGSALAAHLASHSVVQALLGFYINAMMLIVVRKIMLKIWARGEEGGSVKTILGSMVCGLPWFVRVPMTTLVAAYLQAMYDAVGWSPKEDAGSTAGAAFLANLGACVVNVQACLLLGFLVARAPDAAKPNSSWSTFFLNCLHLSFMSASGKSLHYLERIVVLSLVGPIDPDIPKPELVAALFVEQVIMFLIAWYMLSASLPNQMSNPALTSEFTRAQLACQQYVVVYTWAYSAVSFLWALVYEYLGHSTSHALGLTLFLLLLFLALLGALGLAATNADKSFYDMHGDSRKSAAALMLYWLVDFLSWWAWAQVVNSMDVSITRGRAAKEGESIANSPGIIAFNFTSVLFLLFIIGGIHACNEAALHRKKHTFRLHGKPHTAASSENPDDDAPVELDDVAPSLLPGDSPKPAALGKSTSSSSSGLPSDRTELRPKVSKRAGCMSMFKKFGI